MDNPTRPNPSRLTYFGIALAATLGLAACAGAQPQAAPAAKPTEAMAKPTADAMMKPTEAMAKPTEAMAKPTEAMAKPTEAMAKPTEAMAKPTEAMAKPAWQTTKLTDARTGKTFSLADFAGKTVYVENMATWCVNCAQQLKYVKEAQAKLDPNKVVFIGLSVESDLKPADLASYADKSGLGFQFAVLNADQLKLMVDAFGFTAINPPSTPHFVIRPDGTFSKLLTGYEDANALVKSLGGQ
jgi:thiol-disulfide isomerase/thioredoxin